MLDLDEAKVIEELESTFDDYDGHFFCTECFPDLQPGDIYTSLCGVTKTAKFVARELMAEDPPCRACIDTAVCPRHGRRLIR